jgi:hypothetical protein
MAAASVVWVQLAAVPVPTFAVGVDVSTGVIGGVQVVAGGGPASTRLPSPPVAESLETLPESPPLLPPLLPPLESPVPPPLLLPVLESPAAPPLLSALPPSGDDEEPDPPPQEARIAASTNNTSTLCLPRHMVPPGEEVASHSKLPSQEDAALMSAGARNTVTDMVRRARNSDPVARRDPACTRNPMIIKRLLTGTLLAGGLLSTGHIARADGLPPGLHLTPGGRYYQDVCDHSLPRHCVAERLLPASFRVGQKVQPEDMPAPGALTPADVVAAYQIPATASANGQIVATLVTADSHAYADLAVYRQTFGLPSLPLCPGGLPSGTTPCFAQVDESGTPVDQSDAGDAGDSINTDGNTAIQLDMISAGCPDCSILAVQMTTVSDTDFVTSTQTASRLGAVAIDIDWGGAESASGDPTGYTTPGHLVLVANSDVGYTQPASYPTSAPDVLGVGATTLTRSGCAYTETVWNEGIGNGTTGSGCSGEFGMPAFQVAYGAANFGHCGNSPAARATSDVSVAGEFVSGGQTQGVAIYDQGWSVSLGTGVASPLLAGILVRLGVAGAISSDLGFVYEHASAFNDITSGNDDVGSATCTDAVCVAGVGWDGPTGVGTPNGAKLFSLISDAGVMDASTDACPSEPFDSGTADTGTAEAGAGDASSAEDATTGSDSGPVGPGSSDAEADAPAEGGNSGPSSPASSGCGCRMPGVGGGWGGGWLALLAVGLGMVRLRRGAGGTCRPVRSRAPRPGT